MKYPERHLIKSVDLYTQLLWHLPQLYDKNGSHLCFVQGLKNGGGVGTSLVPHEMVLKGKSEMKIDMADPPPTSTSDVNEGYSTNSTQTAFGTRKQRSIKTTSRV